MKDNKDFIFEGIEEDYRVYKNKEGFMEGYKSIGSRKDGDRGTDVKRIVSNQTTLEGFGRYVRGLRRRTQVKDKPLKTSQLPNIPFPD